MTSAVVVGGGVAGMLAARMLTTGFDRVSLVEKDPACGGLLGSIRNADGVCFDHGAHVLSDTGVPEVDAILYDGLDASFWREFRVMRAGNYFGGVMNRTSPFPDARVLNEDIFRRGFEELLAAGASSHDPAPRTLADALEQRFGATFSREVLAPALRKQLGASPEELHPATPFALRRIICGDAIESRQLKQDPRLEDSLAFASYEEGVGAARHRYPREGGIGQWVEGFQRELQSLGVEILTGRTVTTLQRADGQVSSVTLDDGRVLPCDQLAWTIPSAMLLRAAGIPFVSKPPQLRPIGLFHLVFDRPFEDPNYHITCYDEDRTLFRVTLYPNLRGEAAIGPYNCTIEVIGDATTDFGTLVDVVVRELSEMGITAQGAKLCSSEFRVVPMGFPATTHSFIESAANQACLANQHLRNTLLLGRAKCPPFFTPDVLAEAYHASLASCAGAE